MLYLITGGSASGKSEYAEAVAQRRRSSLGEGAGLYYLAAMYPEGAEARERIARHQKMRAGKGFHTLECYTGLARLRGQVPAGSALLLECMSNLLANEMYRREGSLGVRPEGGLSRLERTAEEIILEPLFEMAEGSEWVVVTNEVFSDGVRYDRETDRYCRIGRTAWWRWPPPYPFR